MGRDASPSRVCPEPARPTQRTSARAVRAASPGRTTSRSPPRRPITGCASHRRPRPVRARDRRGGPLRLRVAAQRRRGELPRGDHRPAARDRHALARELAARVPRRRPRPGRSSRSTTLDRRQDARARQARTLSSDSPEELATLARQSAAEDRWDARRADGIDARNAAPRRARRRRESAARDRASRTSSRANRDYQRLLDARRVEELKAAALVPVKLILALSVVFGAIALALVVRRRRTARRAPARRAAARGRRAPLRRRPGALRRGACRSPRTRRRATSCCVRHLEAGAPDAAITVLIRNNSGDRLEPAMPLPDDSRSPSRSSTPSRARCLAVRLSRPVDQGAEQRRDPHLRGLRRAARASRPASRCWSAARSSAPCSTSSAAGRERAERRRIRDSVTQAAPVLANLRNLALAELRAATDALTGLPEPARDRRPPQAAARPGRPLAHADVGDPPRPRPLQGDQRHLRPRARRRGPGRGRRPDARRAARQRLRRRATAARSSSSCCPTPTAPARCASPSTCARRCTRSRCRA